MKFSSVLQYTIILIVVISAGLFVCGDYALAHESGSPNVTQIHYSLRDDDGAENAATFISTDVSGIDTDSSNGISPSTNFRIRLELSNEGTADAGDSVYTLQYAAKGASANCTDVADGNFANVPVTPTTEPVEMTTTTNYADQTASINCTAVTSCNLTDENTSFSAGDVVEDPTATSTLGAVLTSTQFTEMEFNVAFTSNAVNNEIYCFRASPSDTYTVIPGVKAANPSNTIQDHYRWRDDTVDEAGGTTLTIRPTGAGSNTNWSIGTGCSSNYDCVDESSTDEDGSWLRAQADNLQDTYAMANHGSETASITNVRVYVRAYDAAGPEKIIPLVYIGTTLDKGGASTLTGSYADYYADWAQNPDTSSAWTWTNIDNLEAGMESEKSGGFGGDIHVTQVWVVVSYAPGGWKTTEDNPITNLAKSTNVRLRFQIDNTGTGPASNYNYRLEWAARGADNQCDTSFTNETYAAVPDVATTEHFDMTSSTYFADGDDTTAQLTADALSFVAGDMVESTSNQTGNISLTNNQYTEVEYVFQANTNASDSGVYCFRVTNASVVLDQHDVVAQATLAGAGGTITVAGNLYSNETGTPYDCSADTAVTIKAAADGNTAQSADCTASSGAFSISMNEPAGPGSEVVVYVDSGETPNATTITLAADSGSNINGLHMYQNRVAVTYEAGSLITNTNLYDADNTDAGIRYAVTGTDLLTDSGMELHVWTGKTYDPGGEVDTTSGDLHVDDNATVYIDTAGSVIDGDIIVDGGTTGTTLQFQDNTTVAGGAITTLDGGGTNATISYSGTPTVTVTGTGNIGGGTSPSITFYGLTIGTATAASTTVVSSMTVAGTLDVDTSDSLSINSGQTVSNTGTSNAIIDGDITGAGRLRFTNASGGPGAGAGTLSAITRFDASAGNIVSGTFDARTYSGLVEIYSDNSAGAGREVAMANASYTFSGASSHLYVINESATYTLTLDGALNPTVTVGGDLDFTGGGASSEIITSGTGTWTVSGNIDFTGGSVTFTSGNTFQVNGTSKTITSADEIFQNFSVTGTGDVSNADLLTVAANFSIGATANFSHGNNADFLALGEGENAFVIANGGTWDASGAGTGILKMDGTLGDQWFDDQTDPGEQNMGNVQIGQSPGTTKLKADFAAANLTILNGDSLETHGWEVDIAGAIDCQAGATLDVEDNVPNNEGDGTIITAGGNLTFSNTCVYTTDGTSTIRPDGAVDQTFATGSLAFDDIYIDNSAALDADDDVIVSAGTLDVNGVLTVNDGELDLESNDPTTDVEGDVIINVGGELLASSTGSINVAGLWNNNGTFTAGAGTGSVTFDSGDAETIDAGAQAFNIVVFDNAAGSWTIQNDNMTTNSDLTLTAATAFTLNAALTLEVKGDFTLTVVDVNTTWGAGSTLYLNGSGGMYNINTKGHGGDTFITLRIGASEDIAMWDSGATTFTIDAGGCFFSQDHAAVAGRLNVYGTCNSRANEYWSYAKDFEDGAVVARQADVRFADGASLTVDNGETLEIIGQNAGANRSFVTNQGAGNYGLTIDGTINAQYYNFDYLDDSGVNITATATVTELADGNFDNAKAGAASSYITVTGINQTKEFRSCVFDDNGDGVDGNVVYNVNADGVNILWKFLWWDGNKGGESFDNEANNAIVDWSENLSFSISDNVMNLGVINALIVGSDSHNLTVTTNAVNGYTCSAVEDGNIRNNGDDINDVADNTVTAGDEEYGISCADVGDCQLGVNDVALTGAPLTVASNVGRVTASVTPITYEAAADALTAGTTFSHIVTYTCAGDF